MKNEIISFQDRTINGQYLTFVLNGTNYAVSIQFVTEIITIPKFTHVPDMPHYARGIINLRGKIVPLIDMRMRFGLPPAEYSDRTIVIVVSYEQQTIGLVVDAVNDVEFYSDEVISDVPRTNKGSRGEFLTGLARTDKLVMLIELSTIIDKTSLHAKKELVV